MRYLLLAILTANTIACVGWRQAARTVLDATEAACILTTGEMYDDKVVAEACGIADALAPELHKLLEARRYAAIEKAKRMGACP